MQAVVVEVLDFITRVKVHDHDSLLYHKQQTDYVFGSSVERVQYFFSPSQIKSAEVSNKENLLEYFT